MFIQLATEHFFSKCEEPGLANSVLYVRKKRAESRLSCCQLTLVIHKIYDGLGGGTVTAHHRQSIWGVKRSRRRASTAHSPCRFSLSCFSNSSKSDILQQATCIKNTEGAEWRSGEEVSTKPAVMERPPPPSELSLRQCTLVLTTLLPVLTLKNKSIPLAFYKSNIRYI